MQSDKRLSNALLLIPLIALVIFACSPKQSSSPTTKPAGSIASPARLPEYIEADKNAYAAYKEAEAILISQTLNRAEKQQQMRVLQRTYGEELLVTVTRYVPVYDEKTRQVTSFDSYMRSFAKEFGTSSGAPIEADPVGAAVRIFFDPTPETIALMTGIEITPGQREIALKKYQEEQRLREARRQQRKNTLKATWHEVQNRGSEAVTAAKSEAEKAAKEAISRTQKTFSEENLKRAEEAAKREAEKLKRGAEQKGREVSEQAKREADRAMREASERARIEGDKAKRETEKAMREASERGRIEADRAKREAEQRAREAAARLRQDAERAKREAEEKARRAADELKRGVGDIFKKK